MKWFADAQWLHWLMAWVGFVGIVVLGVWCHCGGAMPRDEPEKDEDWDRSPKDGIIQRADGGPVSLTQWSWPPRGATEREHADGKAERKPAG